MEQFYTVYRTTNLLNGKTYIGSHETTKPDDYYIGSGSKLRLAIKKYGKENFKKEVLHIFDNGKDMILKEMEIIKEEMNSRGKQCYNMKADLEGYSEFRDETRDKLKKAAAVRFAQPGVREKIRETSLKQFSDPEMIKKISVAAKKKFEDPAMREKYSRGQKKRFQDPEQRELARESSNKYWSDESNRKKHSEKQLIRMNDPKVRKKVSEGGKRRFEDPAEIERNRMAQKERFKDPELIEKQRQNTLRQFADPAKRKAHSEIMKAHYAAKKKTA